MGLKKFLKDVADFLDLDHFSKHNKKKAIKNLIEKLQKRKRSAKKTNGSKKDKKLVKEQLELIDDQLKKAHKYLHKLEDK